MLSASHLAVLLKRVPAAPESGSAPDGVVDPSSPPIVIRVATGSPRSARSETLIIDIAFETLDEAPRRRSRKCALGAALSAYRTAPCHAKASANLNNFELVLKCEPL